jgi:hypothetical protein
MFILTMICFLIGGVLGLRFKVFILIPTIVLALALVAANGVVVEEGILRLVGTMVVVATSIQLGYLGGSILQSVTCGTDAADHSRDSTRTSTEVAPVGQSRNLGGASSRFETSKQLRRA